MKIDWTKYQQQSLFDFDDPDTFVFEEKIKKKKKTFVDYDLIYEKLKEGPLSFSDIEALTGVARCGVAQVITTLSLRYPVYSPKRGIYKLYGDEEYGSGLKKSLVEKKDYGEW